MSDFVGTHPNIFAIFILLFNVFIHIHEYESDITSNMGHKWCFWYPRAINSCGIIIFVGTQSLFFAIFQKVFFNIHEYTYKIFLHI